MKMLYFGVLCLSLLAQPVAAAGSPAKKSGPAATAKADPGKATKPFRVVIKNKYAETAFTVEYAIKYADGSKPAKGVLVTKVHVDAGGKEKVKIDVPVKNEKDKVTLSVAATSLGETHAWTFTPDLTQKVGVFIVEYDFDAANAVFRVKGGWGLGWL